MNGGSNQSEGLAHVGSSSLSRVRVEALAKRGMQGLVAAEQVEALLQKGRGLFTVGRFQEGDDCLEEALRLKPQDAALLAECGQIHIDSRDRLDYVEGSREEISHYERALKYFHRAAELENYDAQLWLGHMYYVGEGVQRDMIESLRWLLKAAGNDHVPEKSKWATTPEEIIDGVHEEWNEQMDYLVDSMRIKALQMTENSRIQMAEDSRKILKRFEDLMEEKGTPIAKHSHRFTAEVLWGNVHPEDDGDTAGRNN